MDELSVEDLRQSFQSFVDTTLCAVCSESVRPPLVQCVRGHVICEQCKGGADKCPTCQDHFSQVQPPVPFYQLLEALPQRCKFEHCRKYIKKGSDHEKFCGFTKSSCKICGLVVTRNELLAHVVDNHVDQFMFTENKLISWPGFNLDEKKTGYKLFPAYNQLIWLEIISDPDSKFLTLTFQCVPKGKPKSDLFVDVCFTSSGPLFRSKIKLNVDPNDGYWEENIVSVPRCNLPYFISDEKQLDCSVKITTG